MRQHNYKFLSATTSFCEDCRKLVPTKLVEENSQIFLLKYCPEHGVIKEIYEESSTYHSKKDKFDKPGTITSCETQLSKGCPYDCGLCPAHDQHTCIGLIEITNNCDLKCPVCYASSDKGDFLSLEKIRRMMEFYWNSEGGSAEILQISGGEPTTHPNIIEIITMAREIGFPFVMLNTNGIRIADDISFVDELKQFSNKGFEVYLQFDGLSDEVYKAIRGRPLLEIKRKAIKNLAERRIPMTLVTTVSRGVNDSMLGEILSFAMKTELVRGVNIQPMAYFGRQNDNARNPITLSGILHEIELQCGGLILENDFIPLPCNVERVAISYLLRRGESFIPVTRNIDIEAYAPLVENTFLFTAENILKTAQENVSICGCKCMSFLKDFNSILPKDFIMKSTEEKKQFIDTSTFRISISSFVDMRSFDLKSMQKECVHIITQDLRRIPFSAYNMIHRGEMLE